MATTNSQEQPNEEPDTRRLSQGSTNAEQKALDQAHGTMKGSDDDASHDLQAALDRIRLLESGHREMTSLFHKMLASFDNDNKAYSEHEAEIISNTPACEIEIERISNAEWRARQHHAHKEPNYCLLTVAPKERGDISLRSQAVEVQPGPSPGSGKSTVEESAVPTVGGQSISEKPYRAILNGRSELMETLRGIFDTPSAPGFYFWFWPFKHLIDLGEKLRARLSDEESKFRETDQQLSSETSRSVAKEAEDTSPEEDPRLRVKQASDISQEDADRVKDREPEYQDQERPASPGTEQSGHDTILMANETVDQGIKADSNLTDEETRETEGRHSSRASEPETQAIVDTRLRDELRCLVRFMDTDLKNLFSVQKDIDNGTRKLITFDHIWQLYKPGHVVISAEGPKRAYVVLHVTGGRTLQRDSQVALAKDDMIDDYAQKRRKEREAHYAKYLKTSPFVIDCFYLDFDGTNFGPRPQTFTLQEYEGEKAIKSLEVFPIRFDDDSRRTEKLLVKRGRKFVKLASVDHKFYSGRTLREAALDMQTGGTGPLDIPGEVHGEIIVDFALAIRHFRLLYYNWDMKFGTGVIANPSPPDEREIKGYYNIPNAQHRMTMFMEDDRYDNDLRADFLEKTSLLKERSYHEKLPTEALILLPHRVYGFSLLDRKWFAFDISLVEDIKNASKGFDHLVIPDNHKKIMQALVRHHTKGPRITNTETTKLDPEFSMDIIRGKGKGLIVLLHGVPGVGKTSTAECVAAQTGRPLFPITCGDIGSRADLVEERLNNYFDMAHKWGCVLLLDEADVFLTRREKGGDLHRNSIVSVFLRVLEYYSGILILTTNRIGEFDEAFSSRVHIKLYYPKLDKKSTLEIWKMNIRRVAESVDLGVDVDEDEVKRFARRQWADSAENPTQRWNGRQIRNAFQSAIALAKWDHQESEEDTHTRPCLSVKQFEVVAQTSAHFDQYITKMHGVDEGDTWEIMAGRDFLRKNETPRRPASRLVPASTRVRAGRRGGATKAETLEDDDDEADETDTDENEEQMRKLEDRLKKMKLKKQGLSVEKLKDVRRESSKKPVAPEVGAGDSSDSSGEDQD